ncbi:hypothetical protein HYX12_02860 [Candidatus Woesearchaeota archaeon]|nr:hypothetical protein [Candidatus Woesearchaeota archaeon]
MKIGASNIKGEWQTNFLRENFLEAQKILVKNNALARTVGREVILELAAQGGFVPGDSSECGILGTSNVWNKEEQWCLPDLKDNIAQLGKNKLDLALPGNEFFEISMDGTFFTANGPMREVKSKIGTYRFNDSFAVDLGYSFDEYSVLQQTASRLVADCRNIKKLKECLDAKKLEYWKYSSCNPEQELFPVLGRKISFCVTSPSLYTIPFEKTSDSTSSKTTLSYVSLSYSFALDFTSSQPFAVDEITATFNAEGNVEIKFPEDNEAVSYNIYITDYILNFPDLLEQTGTAEYFQEKISHFYSWNVYPIKELIQENTKLIPDDTSCTPSSRQPNNAYLCDGQVIYVLDKSSLSEKAAIAATTLLVNSEGQITESEIKKWAEVSPSEEN